jgi:hypothetical protein
MCVIFACTTEWPSWKILERGAEKNPHGAGIAWIDYKDKKVRWVKGLKSSDTKGMEAEMKKVKQFPAFIHYRTASVGGITPDLTHPFPLTHDSSLSMEGEAGSILMHNGHWHNWKDTMKEFALRHRLHIPEGVWSDSRAMAWIASYLGETILPFLDDKDRTAVLGSDGHWQLNGKWINPEEAGHNEKGFWMSIDVPDYSQRYPKSSLILPTGSKDDWYEKNKGEGTKAKGNPPRTKRGKDAEAESENGEEAPETPEEAGVSDARRENLDEGQGSSPLALRLPGSSQPPVKRVDTSSRILPAVPSKMESSQTPILADAKRICTLAEEDRLGRKPLPTYERGALEHIFETLRQSLV